MSSLVALGKTIVIDSAKPLSIYDNGPAKAYAATDNTRARGKNLIAIVCDPNYIVRKSSLLRYRGLLSPGAALYVAHGTCFWPPTGDHRFIIIYEHNFFNPVMPDDKTILPAPWRDNEVIDFFIRPMVSVLVELEARALFHGAIRLSNTYLTAADRNSIVVLGDGFGAPPSSTQSIIYEPIERALAHPLGRGEGINADDIYAFGVCVALLLRTVNPVEGLRPEEIIDYKLQHGSFAALAGKDRLSGHVLEVVRGCLQDNIEQRWKIEDLQSWAEGRRLTPQQSYRKKKAVRPMDFGGQKCNYSRELAYYMRKNQVLAQSIIENGEIIEWLERSVNDNEMSEAIKSYLGRDLAKAKTKGNNAAMVSAVISILEPSFPVFYKECALFPSGAGDYIAHSIRTEEELSDIVEMILNNVFLNYLFLQSKSQIASLYIKLFESCRLSLNQQNVGFGFERCVYILSRDAHCLSPKFMRYFVSSIDEMMAAFEDLCIKKFQKNSFFLDRHSMAFLSIHDGGIIDSKLYDLNTKTKHQNIMANLKVLANMQKRVKNGYYPNITRVFCENMNELLVRFHDKELRKVVESELHRGAKSGNVNEVIEIIDNQALKKRDREDFRKAMREYATLKDEYRMLDSGVRNPSSFGVQTGHKTAAGLSWTLALIIIVMMTILHLSGLKK